MSVIVPTWNRPDLVAVAVRSALAQRVDGLEVIVVVDGRDEETTSALRLIGDERIVVHVPHRRMGSADARNEGVRLASASWVAFLDDDDEWLPRKLEFQLDAARASGLRHPIVTCRLIARDESGDRTWPRRRIREGEALSEYFFCRRTPFTGEGMVINSAVLTSRELVLRVPFQSGLERHVDPDWMLRAAAEPDAGLIYAATEDPLVIWNIESERPRITNRRNWRESLAWCSANRGLFTDRSYAAFVLHVVSSAAAAEGEWKAFLTLLRHAFLRGSPAAVDLVSHAGNFAIPRRAQRRIAALFGRAR